MTRAALLLVLLTLPALASPVSAETRSLVYATERDLGLGGAKQIAEVFTVERDYGNLTFAVACPASVGAVTIAPVDHSDGVLVHSYSVSCPATPELVAWATLPAGSYLVGGAAAGQGTFRVELWGTPK